MIKIVRLGFFALVCAMGSLAGVLAAPAAAKFRVEILPLLPGQSQSAATGVNGDGNVVGSCGANAILWLQGTPTDLNSFTGAADSGAVAINDAGQVLCWVKDGTGKLHTWVYFQGQASEITALAGITFFPQAMNAEGSIVGFTTAANGTARALLWQPSTPASVTDLGDLGGKSAVAFGINSTGTVVGFSALETFAGRKVVIHGFVWRESEMRDIGSLGAGWPSSAHAINETMEIVGQADGPARGRPVKPGAASLPHAFLSRKGSLRDINPASWPQSDALAINNAGEIVGYAYTVKAGGVKAGHAWLWQSGRGYDLNTLAIGAPGVTLLKAVAINDKGEIACNALFGGVPRAVLLTPSAP